MWINMNICDLDYIKSCLLTDSWTFISMFPEQGLRETGFYLLSDSGHVC